MEIRENEVGENDLDEVLDGSETKVRWIRSINYTELGDLCLVRAWEAVSHDDQSGKKMLAKTKSGLHRRSFKETEISVWY
jgi:hypothetical protein